MIGLTKELVRDLFNYDAETGMLTNKMARGSRAKAGGIAGFVSASTGYLMVGINGCKYLVHRVCFLHYHGHLPSTVDHKDTAIVNNRILNLRGCTRSQNAFNSKKPKTNMSGIKGVSWHEKSNRWRCRIMSKGKEISLGYFVDIEEAKKVIEAARQKHHGEFVNHG